MTDRRIPFNKPSLVGNELRYVQQAIDAGHISGNGAFTRRCHAHLEEWLGARRAFVVHGAGGIDELSPVGPNLVCEVADGRVLERQLDPESELGVPRCPLDELRGGTPEENAQAIRDVFAGADGGRRSAVLLNAAGAIAAAGHAADLREGLELAREAVDSGAAAARLEALAAFSRAEGVVT